VKAKIDAIKEIHEKFKDRIALVGINSNDSTEYPDDSFENMKIIAQEKEIKFDYLVDGDQEIAKKYGAVCTPDPFLFDSERRLVFHGKIDNAMKPEDTATEKTMISNIQRFLDGEKIEKDFDPSIGCSIKWK
jgi:peroxiredoxin